MKIPSWNCADGVTAIERLLATERDRLAWVLFESSSARVTRTQQKTKRGSSITTDNAVFWIRETKAAQNADLYFIDPPFNIGQKYDGYTDKLDADSHWALWRLMIQGVAEAGNDHSTFAFHVPEEMLLQTLQHAEDCGLTLWQHIVRTFNFGQYCETKFIRGHENLLLFRKAFGESQFNAESVLVEGARRLMPTPDKRIKTAKWKGYVPPATTWHHDRPQGNNRERWKHMPNQLPFAYLARLVLAKSTTSVVELCAGSGSLLMVCEAAGRKYIGCELSQKSVDKIIERSGDAEQQQLASEAVESVQGPETIELPPGRDWEKV